MGKVIRVRNISIGRGRPKLCVSVMGETADEVLERAQLAQDAECDLIEFRADFFKESTDLAKVKSLMRKLRRTVSKPLIFTLRTKSEGGKVDVSADYYLKVVQMVADNGLADLVDVEACHVEGQEDFIDSLKDAGSFVIISRHDFGSTPSEEEILEDFRRMEQMGADVVKAAYMPNSRRDVLNLISATEEMTGSLTSPPVIAISMGRMGIVTRIMGEFLENAITFAALKSSSAPGQINVHDMATILDIIHNNYRKVILVGVLGAGKTKVANILSNTYGLNRIDLNAYIESKEQTSVSDLAQSDMELFLDKQTKYLRQVLSKDYQVISAGWGIALRQENIDMIKENGIIVYLKAEPETIAARIKRDKTRGMLADVLNADYLADLMRNTAEIYENVADVKIITDNKTAAETSKEIVETLGFTM